MWTWLRNLRYRADFERDLDEELRSTLEALVEEKLASGLSRERARREALLQLQIEPVKERVRDVKAGVTLEAVLQDVRYAWRHLTRSPGFALAAVLTLALGIGANAAMFSMLNALTLERLPIADPDGLIAIAPKTSRGLTRGTPVSAVEHLQNGPLDRVCGYLGGVVFPVLANDVPLQAYTTFVTSECFNTFGIKPLLGRTITEAEAPLYAPGARVALISHRLWADVFGGDQAVLGRSMQVNGIDLAIIGVLPRGFVGVDIDYGIDIFTTFDSVIPAGPTRRQLASFILGRLRPDVTLEQATAELAARWPAILEAVLPATLAPSEREQLRDSTLRLERFGTGFSRNRELYVRPLTLILALTLLLLVLACVNLGGLLLARLAGRTSKLSIRLALGGTRWRIAQQMLVESLLLSVAGALLALPVAYAVVTLLVSYIPPFIVNYTMSFTPDLRVVGVTAGIAVTVGVLMSALPVSLAVHRQRGPQVAWDRTIAGSTSRWSRGLLVGQVALSVVLLVAAALLTRSLYLLQQSDLGVRTARLLDAKLPPRPGAPAQPMDRASYYRGLLERVSALPGVHAVALAEIFPRAPRIQGRTPAYFSGQADRAVDAGNDYVSPEFFDTVGIRLLAGRNVAWTDTADTRPVVVVSESLARALSPDLDVLERQVTWRTLPTERVMTIVGIVTDATQGNPRNTQPHTLYTPYLQMPAVSDSNPNVLIDAADHASVAAGVRQVLHGMGHHYAQEIISVDRVIRRAPSTERMSATVAAPVGMLAVLLALIGVHGVLAYSVARRRREIAVRVAVGATTGMIARRVVRDGVLLTMAGLAIGLPLATLGARSLQSLLFGISALDVTTFAAVTVFFLALGAAAGLLPAGRAAAVDPVEALRGD